MSQSKAEIIEFTIANAGMTPDEAECIYHITQAWAAYLSLPEQHSADKAEFYRAIHQLQDLMAIRTARRDHPMFWKNGCPVSLILTVS